MDATCPKINKAVAPLLAEDGPREYYKYASIDELHPLTA